MKYTREFPTLSTSQVNSISAFELLTLTTFSCFVTGDPAGTEPVEPVRLEHEALMTYENASGALTIDTERELAVLKAKFEGFHAARTLPQGVVKVKLLSLETGIVYAAHAFLEDSPVEFFNRLGDGQYRRMPI
ncbi:hypothetical protein [Roseimicrobium sp. ORNL1]|uniref:hypothetical protein n=1 Tax=Roseimicrobium sp. ORNL1 TaxID=2711231 RepID=UPI0013E15D00|nr:hypothetical protein [Roseimicrobium sp. ORNL1]QIF04633.1 hypothetical protein G5S37_24925 [Roseimicrobium sp. ORNL1]